jgi:lysophospholipase L1-like esterase
MTEAASCRNGIIPLSRDAGLCPISDVFSVRRFLPRARNDEKWDGSTLRCMTRNPLRSPRPLWKLSPFLQPAALSALFALAGAGIACGSDGGASPASGGHGPSAGGASAGSANPAGGSGPAGGSTSSGGSVGVAGSAPIGGSAPIAGSGGTASGGTASGAGGSGTGGSGSATAGSGGSGIGTGGTGAGGGGAMHWVGTWTASPYATATDGMPPSGVTLANGVTRQITHASLGGKQIRVQYSNKKGTTALTIKAAHVALCKATPLVDSTIDTTTDKALTFSGSAMVSIPAGMEVWSDAVAFDLPALGNVTITTAFGSVPSEITSHNGSRTDSYFQNNSTDVSVANMASALHITHWYFISGMDVMAPADAKGIVAIGDSITDGRGVDPNANNRWTDYLAARLQANTATKNVSLMNQGIGATNLIGTSNDAAEGRFARDVLGQSGVKYVIIFDGVNDIGGSSSASFSSLKTVYDKLIKAGRDKGLLVYGGTILPFGGNSYYSDAHEAVRQQVNTYIKSGAFDGVIDFDAAVTNGKTGANEPSLLPATNSVDQLHPGPAGYKMMADKVDLTLFTK